MTGDDSIIPKINNPKRILLLLFCKELFRVSYKISMLLFEPSFHYRYFKLTDYADFYSVYHIRHFWTLTRYGPLHKGDLTDHYHQN